MARQRHCRRLARNGKPGASLLTPSSNQLPRPAQKAGFSTFESRSGRETDCLLEERGFETSVPRHGEVRAALHYSISGGVCGTGSGAAFDRAFPCSAGRYDRAYPFGGDGHPSTDKLVGASGVQRELRGQIIVRHIWATGELSNPRPSFGCLKCLPTMSSKSSMSTTMCGSKA